MKQHLLHVFPNFKVGGAQVRLSLLIERLGRQFRHTIISIDGNRSASGILPPDADVVFAQCPPRAAPLAKRLRSYHDALETLSPDKLITYNWGSIEWVIANIFHEVPNIHVEDGFGPDEARRQLLRRVWTRRLALRRSTVVVPSLVLHDIATRCWKLDPRTVKYIPNGIAPQNVFRTSIESLGLDLPPDLPRVVWVGALRHEKNLLRLLHAFSPLRGKAVLLVIGDGPERKRMEQEAEKLSLPPHIRFLGQRADARDIIMQCDVMALSSDTEQMPFAILEGMDAGLAIASVDVGDIRHMVASENNPYIVAKRTNALTGALDSLLGNPAFRVTVGQANRQRSRDAYDIGRMTSQYESLFNTRTIHASTARLAHV